MHFEMLSAVCFNLDLSKILSSDNGLTELWIESVTNPLLLRIALSYLGPNSPTILKPFPKHKF